MDAAALQFNFTSQPATGGVLSATAADDAAALGLPAGEDLFAALLAQQLGQGAVTVPQSMPVDPALQDAVLEDVAARLLDGQSQPAAALDPALQMQQAAMAAQGMVVVATEVRQEASPPVTADARPVAAAGLIQPDVTPAATPAMHPSSTSTDVGQSQQAIAANEGSVRQPVAEAAAEIADAEVAASPEAKQEFAGMLARIGKETAPVGNQAASVAMAASAPAPHIPAGPASTNASQPSAVIAPPVGQSAWGESLGDRMVWMVSQQHQGVELHLNPPSLGPLEVRLSMNDGQATLSFATQHLPVKEAIESATPRLREMLGESGISLGGVSVNVGSFAQQQSGQSQSPAGGSTRWAENQPVADFSSNLTSAATRVLGGNGMVDTFA